MKTCTEIFTDIYARKLWGEGSGGGADPEARKPWAEAVSRVIAEMKPRTVVSVGCGDGWADAEIELGKTFYVGIDCVPWMVDYCREHHSAANRSYLMQDIVNQDITSQLILCRWFVADLVLCKEVTQHLDDDAIYALLNQFKYAKAVIHCSSTTPGDLIGTVGGFRPVWLSREPFSLPTEPLIEWQYGDTVYQAEILRP